MTAKEKNEIKQSIEAEIKTLNKSISTLMDLADSELQSDANDWFSSKESNISKDINEQALTRARQRIIILNRVLLRIDNSDYGICVVCKKPIPLQRLKAVPSAFRCVECN